MAHFCLFRKIDELLTMTPLAAKDGRRPQEADLGLVEDGAVLIENGHIRWAGQEKELSAHLIKSLVG
ncbi:MAG: hypothetical protein KDD43_02275, partial [Bdellovibrionales bacterium]|nr:hypothetical protein [Bdellovibrionales bacterium]